MAHPDPARDLLSLIRGVARDAVETEGLILDTGTVVTRNDPDDGFSVQLDNSVGRSGAAGFALNCQVIGPAPAVGSRVTVLYVREQFYVLGNHAGGIAAAKKSTGGPTGPTGPAGPAGPTGPASTITGPTGATGPTGPQGSSSMTIAISDETTAITTGTAKVTMRAPFAMSLSVIPRASLTTASSSGNPTVDINVAGTSILGANKLSVDATEKTSVTAATATTLAAVPTTVADDAEITFDVDVAGTGAAGLKVTIYYTRV